MKRLARLRRMLVSDGRGDAQRIERIFRKAYQGGVRAFQVRERTLSDRDLLRLLLRLRRILPRGRALLLANDRIDLAMAAQLDGVHLGFRSLSPSQARRLLGPRALIGVSIHRSKESKLAAREGANFVIFGPVFATPSKRGILTATGIPNLQRAVRESPLPVIAIGGVGVTNVRRVLDSGCAGIACIREIFTARSPRSRARTLVEAIP